jgi:threonine synthase
MDSLDQNKKYQVGEKIKEGLSQFYGGFANMEETNETIGKMYEKGYLMDTHTAVAYKVYQDYKKETGDETVTVIASTASAYKFADSVATSIGLPKEKDGFAYVASLHEKTGVTIPSGLVDLEKKPVLHTGVLEKDEMYKAVNESL